MKIKYFFLIVIFFVSFKVYSNELNLQIESGSDTQESAINSRKNCNKYGLLCDVYFGLKMAESQGVNGIILSGYAYHLPPGNKLHIPDGKDQYNSNELAWGMGYSRSFYNPDYNSEYTLFLLGFEDSYSQPQFQGGFTYQKFINITDSGNDKFGYGYLAAIWSKPAFTGELPIPFYLPIVTPMISLKIHDVNIILNFAYVVALLNIQIDLPDH